MRRSILTHSAVGKRSEITHAALEHTRGIAAPITFELAVVVHVVGVGAASGAGTDTLPLHSSTTTITTIVTGGGRQIDGSLCLVTSYRLAPTDSCC